eukprot:scaffold61429_cov34-Attheya_sp.AAC.1
MLVSQPAPRQPLFSRIKNKRKKRWDGIKEGATRNGDNTRERMMCVDYYMVSSTSQQHNTTHSTIIIVRQNDDLDMSSTSVHPTIHLS